MRRVAGLAALALAACVDTPPAGHPACGREIQRTIPLPQPMAIDLLFVVDRSGSMDGEQATLLGNARGFATNLEQIEGGLPDLHMAVVTSDLGAQGVAGCGLGDGARFLGAQRCGISGTFLSARRGDQGVADAFSCLLDLPFSACGVSQPIAAMVRALDGSEPENDGFRRPGAYLVVVVITDGDDCSLIDRSALSGLASEDAVDARCAMLGEPPLASIGDSIDWIRPDDPKFLIGVLIADQAPRLAQLEAALPERFTRVDASGPNWGDAFVQLGGWGPPIANPCFDPAIDLQPTVPGIQPECVGSLHTQSGSTRLPWCAQPGASPPCMRAHEDSQTCLDEVAIDVELGDERIVGDVWADIRCALACD